MGQAGTYCGGCAGSVGLVERGGVGLVERGGVGLVERGGVGLIELVAIHGRISGADFGMPTVTVISILMGSASRAETISVPRWTPGASIRGIAVTVARSPVNADPASGVVPWACRSVSQEPLGVDNV